MVEDAIRRVLPQVMNEVLIKVVAGSNVIQERAASPQRPAPRAQPRRPSSLSHLLDETAGADFYEDPRAAMAQSIQEETPPRGQDIAQRIQSLPPALQQLAEGTMEDDGGEMWESDMGDSVVVPSAGNGPPLDRAAKAVGLDFSRMKQVANVTESKKRVDADDRRANAQFEAMRLKRMREQLNGGKPVE